MAEIARSAPQPVGQREREPEPEPEISAIAGGGSSRVTDTSATAEKSGCHPVDPTEMAEISGLRGEGERRDGWALALAGHQANGRLSGAWRLTSL
jgi:hypothetical protein